MDDRTDVTLVLKEWTEGDSESLYHLMPAVCDELRRIAGYKMRSERNITLQPTALVSEFFLRLSGQRSVCWKNSAQFFGFAAKCMERILQDYGRRRKRQKRGSGIAPIPLDDRLEALFDERGEVIQQVQDALVSLEKMDARLAQIVRLRFFVGLNVKETGAVLGLSKTTIVRSWNTARAFLKYELGQSDLEPLLN